MLENGKPDIVLKTVKGFKTQRTPFIILIPEKSLNWELLSLPWLIKMLVTDLTIDFYSRYGLES